MNEDPKKCRKYWVPIEKDTGRLLVEYMSKSKRSTTEELSFNIGKGWDFCYTIVQVKVEEVGNE